MTSNGTRVKRISATTPPDGDAVILSNGLTRISRPNQKNPWRTATTQAASAWTSRLNRRSGKTGYRRSSQTMAAVGASHAFPKDDVVPHQARHRVAVQVDHADPHLEAGDQPEKRPERGGDPPRHLSRFHPTSLPQPWPECDPYAANCAPAAANGRDRPRPRNSPPRKEALRTWALDIRDSTWPQLSGLSGVASRPVSCRESGRLTARKDRHIQTAY